MAERTRNWAFDTEDNSACQGRHERKPFLEFDFLAILSRDKMGLEKTAKETCQGHVNIFRPYEDNISCKAKGVFLSPKDVADRFQEELVYSVAKSCHCVNAHHHTGLGYAIRRNRESVCCRKCMVHRDTGSMIIASDLDFGHPYEKQCNLIFKWRSKAKTLYAKDYEISSGQPILLDRIFILVDLLPAYPFDDTKMELLPEGKCRLIPKLCKVCPNRRCWRVSHCISEMNLVGKCTEMHKQVYMALKIFISISFPKSRYGYLTMSSYILKTAFIQHIDNCLDECFLDCVYHILHSLSASFRLKELRNYFTQYNLLDQYEHLGEEFHSERNSCFLIILHIVRLSELTGSEHCTLDIMRPYLRGTKDIHENLLKKGETLDSYLCHNINLKQEHTHEILTSIRDARPLPELPGEDQGDHTDSSEEYLDTVTSGRSTSNASWDRPITMGYEPSCPPESSHDEAEIGCMDAGLTKIIQRGSNLESPSTELHTVSRPQLRNNQEKQVYGAYPKIRQLPRRHDRYDNENKTRVRPSSQTQEKTYKNKVKPYHNTSIASRICSVQ